MVRKDGEKARCKCNEKGVRMARTSDPKWVRFRSKCRNYYADKYVSSYHQLGYGVTCNRYAVDHLCVPQDGAKMTKCRKERCQKYGGKKV